mmetsp:Transcript_114627/g.209843  ORF Transcript_114627/g.209843 Transcript_114627/m.209843 type:complete len:207 (+) Transcript_114627:85-705(+)
MLCSTSAHPIVADWRPSRPHSVTCLVVMNRSADFTAKLWRLGSRLGFGPTQFWRPHDLGQHLLCSPVASKMVKEQGAHCDFVVIPFVLPVQELPVDGCVTIERPSQLPTDRAVAIGVTQEIYGFRHRLIKRRCMVYSPECHRKAIQGIGAEVPCRNRIAIVAPATRPQSACNVKAFFSPCPTSLSCQFRPASGEPLHLVVAPTTFP